MYPRVFQNVTMTDNSADARAHRAKSPLVGLKLVIRESEIAGEETATAIEKSAAVATWTYVDRRRG
jgi:hypothetical protein